MGLFTTSKRITNVFGQQLLKFLTGDIVIINNLFSILMQFFMLVQNDIDFLSSILATLVLEKLCQKFTIYTSHVVYKHCLQAEILRQAVHYKPEMKCSHTMVEEVSISPTFYTQQICTKVFSAAFCTYILGLYFLVQEYFYKSCSQNVGEIDTSL